MGVAVMLSSRARDSRDYDKCQDALLARSENEICPNGPDKRSLLLTNHAQ